MVYGEISLASWVLYFLGASVACAAFVLFVARRALGAGQRRVLSYVRQWKEGILFSVSLASQSAYNDIDKAMLSSLSSLSANGIYSAAYRVVEIGFAPMKALLSAAYPRFFAAGAQGLRSSVHLARRLAVPSLLICLLGSVALFLGAQFLPVILGPEYEDSTEALRLLAVLPLVRGVQYLAADALTGAGQQGLRSVAQAAVALLNVGLNLVLIPAFSWRGAIASTLVCDGVLAVLLWVIVAQRLRRADRAENEKAA
jgi:O-antigen/teichoic acid export membrane protein